MIDFMAPLFPIFSPCTAKMFQKKLEQVEPTPAGFSVPGDFLSFEKAMTDNFYKSYASKPACFDLLQIAEDWYI